MPNTEICPRESMFSDMGYLLVAIFFYATYFCIVSITP